MRILILSQPYKVLKKLPNKVLKKTRKIPHKLKIMELVHIYFILLNKSSIITNFLAFFIFPPQNLPPWIRILNADPGGKMNADPDSQPCLKYSYDYDS